MCGIAGQYVPAGSPDRGVLDAMNDCLSHRGPDDEGVFIDGPVGLAHRRLSIIGVETGHQPLFNEDGSVAVVFNGEIYNYRSLRGELTDAGHEFRTETDTEVLVHCYEEYGPEFVGRIEGMFAFALWDSDAERLFLARDRLGIKPLLVADDGSTVAFGSELSALFESAVDHGGLDETAIARYFSLGYVPAPRSAFRNVRKLQPGQLAVVTSDGIEYRKYYTPSIERRDCSFADAVSGLRTRVTDAVERRLMSDVPLGAFLSGGLDSSIVVATMAAVSDDPVRTFTVGFEESLFDESGPARDLADYHDTDHTTFTLTPDDVREAIPTVVDRLGEPFADQSLVPTYVVSRETRRDVKVALSGDGADELFAGYSRYRGELFSEYYRRVPRSVRNRLVEPVVGGLPTSRRGSGGELVRKAQKFLRGGTAGTVDRHFKWARVADDDVLAGCDGIDAAEHGRDALRAAHGEIVPSLPPERRDPLSRMLAVDTRFGLPNQILHKTDQASMYNGLEVRVPFLDTEVVEYAMSLPVEYKITPRKQKRVLERAFEDRLPPSILARGKRGFDMPIGEWFKSELEAEFRDRVTGLDSELVDTRDVMSTFEDHCAGDDHEKFLWAVYVFARWHDRMVERNVI